MSRDIQYIGMDVHKGSDRDRRPEWQWEAGHGNHPRNQSQQHSAIHPRSRGRAPCDLGRRNLGGLAVRSWLALKSQPLACVASEPNGVEHHCFMKPSSWDKQLGLALPLERAAGQSRQTNNPSKNEVGLDVSHHTRVFPRGGEKLFFLTSSFIG